MEKLALNTGGALLWNFDCQYSAWGMKNSNETMGINWKEAMDYNSNTQYIE